MPGKGVFLPHIGLLSDSHGRWPTTRRAVDALLEAGAEMLLHLGDIGNVEVIDALAVESPQTGEQIPARIVFGNTDWDTRELGEYAQDLGIAVDHPAGRITLETGELAYCHGHETLPMEKALADDVRYLCHGHTHRTLDTHRGSTRIINPGALFRAKRYTAAMLDTQNDDLSFLTIGETSDALR
jgi:hypothetical protein